MELETVRLIATDTESNKLVTKLHEDNIFCRGKSLMMNIILVSSLEGSELIDDFLLMDEQPTINIIICLNRELEINTNKHYQSILYLSEEKDSFQALKDFLSAIRYNIEIHGLVGFDFRDFKQIISGKNLLSIQIAEFSKNLSEGFCLLKTASHIPYKRFLISLYFKDHNDFTKNQADQLNDFMESYQTGDDTFICWNLHENQKQQIMIMATKPLYGSSLSGQGVTVEQ